MKQVAFRIYRILDSGKQISESTGRGYLVDNQLIVAQQTADGKSAYLKQFDVSKLFSNYNGWVYGFTTYHRKSADGEIFVENWHISYRVLGEC